MSVHYTDDTVTLLLGDAAEQAATLAPQSVQTVVTSPPYFGLRDYGVEGQLGAESSPSEFVANLVAVFEAIRPALADDGVLWVNLGDSYSGSWGNQGRKDERGTQRPINGGMITPVHDGRFPSKGSNTGKIRPGMPPAKNLMGIPWRFAFAMQDAGWVLRNDIIWAKPNGMPESVRDRFSTKHEHIFLFAKSPRYYFDLDAVREPHEDKSLYQQEVARRRPHAAGKAGSAVVPGQAAQSGMAAGGRELNPLGANPGDVWDISTKPFAGAHFAVFPPEIPERCILASTRPAGKRCDCDEEIGTPTGEQSGDDPTATTGRAGMNRPRGVNEGRRVVTRRTQRHHARELRESAHRSEIEAMCTDTAHAFAHYLRTDRAGARPLPPALMDDLLARGWITNASPCDCPEQPGDVVLDPFSGSGTTGMVATRHGRKYVGIDLNAEYHDLALKTRLAQGVLA